MEQKILSPSVEHGGKTDLRTQPARIGGQFQQRLTGGAEQQAIQHAPILQAQRLELLGQCEDDMEVRRRQEPRQTRLHPLDLASGLALRAMAIAAGVVGDLDRSAGVTGVDMPA